MYPATTREPESLPQRWTVRADPTTQTVCYFGIVEVLPAYDVSGEEADVEAFCEALPEWMEKRVHRSGTSARVFSWVDGATDEGVRDELRRASDLAGIDVRFGVRS